MKVNLKILPFMKLTSLDRENSSTGAIAETELETKWGGLYNENFCICSRKCFGNWSAPIFNWNLFAL